MFVTQLSLSEWRSYPELELALDPGVSVFEGANGQGKTNLVEAVWYLSTLSSHRVAGDAPLIRQGSDRAVVRARIQAGMEDDRALTAEIQLNVGKANRAALNGSPLRRQRDILGSLRSVMFAPEDLGIVKGDPVERRRFIDELATTRWPRLAGVRADYEKALRQRTVLLRNLASDPRRASDSLPDWDGQVAGFGAELLAARLAVLAELRPLVASAYADIAPANDVARISYKSAVAVDEESAVAELRQALLDAMAVRRPEELVRGLSLVGPHRDDLVLTLGELPAKGYASHGESWSFALALKLASFELLRQDALEPVLLLDDVFAELDETRRERLATRAMTAEQVLVTAAVAADVPAQLRGRRYRVSHSAVEEVA
jgi:DNA replication and repair protein RecF